MTRTATVISGPSVWLEKQGPVIFMDLDWVVVQIEGKDDCGSGTFMVRFPIGCVKVVTELATA